MVVTFIHTCNFNCSSCLHHLPQGKIWLLHHGCERSIHVIQECRRSVLERTSFCDLSLCYSLTTRRKNKNQMLLCILAVGQSFGSEEGQLKTCLHLISFLPRPWFKAPGSFIKRAVSLSRIKERGGADLQHTQHQNSSFICFTRVKWKTRLTPNALLNYIGCYESIQRGSGSFTTCMHPTNWCYTGEYSAVHYHIYLLLQLRQKQ